MRLNKLLIIGTVPPPSGGLGVHLERLMAGLKEEVSFDFFDFRKDRKSVLLIKLFKFHSLHLHTSSPFLRFILAVFTFITRKKLVITYHGDLGRHKGLKNFFDYAACLLCTVPIVLNDASFKKALELNKRSQIVSAFLPPHDSERLDSVLNEQILQWKKKYKHIFCTNAYDLSFDKYGKEVYGLSELILKFEKYPEYGLIICNPTGTYLPFLQENRLLGRPNIFIIYENLPFVEILKISDFFVRNTTTDGDSLSIHESLFYKKPVIATDVVSRLPQVYLYNSFAEIDLERVIELLVEKSNDLEGISYVDSINSIKKIYRNACQII